MKRAALLAILLAGAATAGEPISGEEFRRLSEGWTLHFADESGEWFGSEQYFADGRTLWLPRGGQCEPGAWDAAAGEVCFRYAVGVSCWRLFRDGADGLVAETADGSPPLRLRLVGREREPLLCPEGPGV